MTVRHPVVPAALALVWGLFASAGCGTPAPTVTDTNGISGDPTEVHAMPGSYDGYLVVTDCAGAATMLAVEGTGTRSAEELTELEDRLEALSAWKEGRVAPALAEVDSFHAHGVGAACQPGSSAVRVFLAAHADVDQTTQILGALLREEDTNETIVIEVMAVPVVH